MNGRGTDRRTGIIAAAVACALAAAAVAFGVGISNATPRLSDIGAWLLSHGKGVSHVNGLSGAVDGRIELVSAKSSAGMKVVQEGASVLLVDESTGTVSRIDPTQLSVVQTRRFPAEKIQVVIGSGAAYAIDLKGSVQQIDAASLEKVGAPVALPGPLGLGGVDDAGRLWVPAPATGQLVPIQAGRPAQPVTVGEPRDRLSLTMAAGQPVVTNTSQSFSTLIAKDGRQVKINLPAEVREAPGAGVLVPVTTEGPVVPVLAPAAGKLVMVDTATGASMHANVDVTGRKVGAPQALGRRVYIPDQSSGRLLVYDTAARKMVEELPVSGRGGTMDVFVKDGLLWANDPKGEKAVVVDSEGRSRGVEKDDEDAPGPTRTAPPTTAAPDPQATARQDDGDRRGQGRDDDDDRRDDDRGRPDPSPSQRGEEPEPDPSPTAQDPDPGGPSPTPDPREEPGDGKPTPPGNVTASTSASGVTVTFTPSTGTVQAYELRSTPPGVRVSPRQVDAEGPFQFTVTGGDCQKEYTFRVVARSKAGTAESEPTASVRPCAAPQAPTNFRGRPMNRAIALSWDAPPGAGPDTEYVLGLPDHAVRTVRGTSAEVKELANNRSYSFSLSMKNGAGEVGGLSVTVSLAYPRRAYKNANNNQTNTLIRPGPSASGEIGKIEKGKYLSLTVICQVKGESYTEPESKQTSDVWNRVAWGGRVGYLSDTLMTTPKGSFPGGPLYECTD
ncbi:fibronectin type III domain-containing protein [Bailinhaonella thermotolerans]|uniref:Fibronectin type III domain-containing protein n=1 Tax=Bailinhaonella thermotolerans TaxID=1070861 RepID=A0A3A4B7B1_9ACTN|nr:fibronectin type III domain-containing protein [Bailinhaonella thermotolerans]RJL34111.1 fibronectin type III domain-containing protein [Bailinhaonella thermotolerans]